MDDGDAENLPIDFLDLPPAVQQLLEQLDADQRISLQAYLEINNHLGEYPLHLVLAGLEEIRPGTTEEVMGESAAEAAWDRQNRRIALYSEIVIKFLTSIVTWAIALLGVWFAVKMFQHEPSSWEYVAKGVALLVFCIGGPVAAAKFAGNSGLRVGAKPEFEQDD